MIRIHSMRSWSKIIFVEMHHIQFYSSNVQTFIGQRASLSAQASAPTHLSYLARFLGERLLNRSASVAVISAIRMCGLVAERATRFSPTNRRKEFRGRLGSRGSRVDWEREGSEADEKNRPLLVNVSCLHMF